MIGVVMLRREVAGRASSAIGGAYKCFYDGALKGVRCRSRFGSNLHTPRIHFTSNLPSTSRAHH